MGKLIINNKEVEVEDGKEIKVPCEEAGIPFGCESGVCRTCEIEIHEGGENLSERTENEKDMCLEGGNRLACQCKLKQGTVKLVSKWQDE